MPDSTGVLDTLDAFLRTQLWYSCLDPHTSNSEERAHLGNQRKKRIKPSTKKIQIADGIIFINIIFENKETPEEDDKTEEQIRQ